MSTSFDTLMSCADVTREHVVGALASRAGTHALLVRLARVARSGDRTERVLFVLASIAGGHAEWFDSDLRVEVQPEGTRTVIHTLVDLGSGQHERLFPSYAFDVPYSELKEVITDKLGQLTPLEFQPSSHGIVLSTLDDDAAWGDDRIRVGEGSMAAESLVHLGRDEPPPSARPTKVPGATWGRTLDGAAAPAQEAPFVVSHAAPTPEASPRLVLRPTVTVQIQVPPEALREEAHRSNATVRAAVAPVTTRVQFIKERALHYMNERVDGISPTTPRFIVSASLLAELREDGRETPTPLDPSALQDEIPQSSSSGGDRDRRSQG